MPSRRFLAFGALLFIGFLFYGSQVTFTPAQVTADLALDRFMGRWSAPFEIQSRVDFSSNVLLMIPISFCLMGFFWRERSAIAMFVTAICILCLCFAISITVEFSQEFISVRSPAPSDVVAQTLGAICGVVLWVTLGASAWQNMFGNDFGYRLTSGQKLIRVYLLFLVGYNLMPLDISVHPFDVYEKWKAGKIEVVPFSFEHRSIVEFSYSYGTDVIIWSVLAAMLFFVGKRTAWSTFRFVFTVILALEFAQIFIMSRISSTADVLIAAISTAVALSLFSRFRKPTEPSAASAYSDDLLRANLGLPLLGIIGYLIWFSLVCGVFWFPYQFELNRELLNDGISRLTSAPFHAYYKSSPLSAGSSLMRRLLFFAPFGLFLVLALWPLMTMRARVPLSPVVAAVAFVTALVIEGGQMFVVERIADSTDVLLQAFGVLIGYTVGLRLLAPGQAESR